MPASAGSRRSGGTLDICVNNAGIQRRAPFTEFAATDWHDLLATNLTSAFLVGQRVARGMIVRGSGKIVNIGSVQSRLARPNITPYAATKGGIVMLTQGMCAELGPHGIQANALAPGYFATELTKALVDDAEFSDWVARRTPAGRWGRVQRAGRSPGVPGLQRLRLRQRPDALRRRRHDGGGVMQLPRSSPAVVVHAIDDLRIEDVALRAPVADEAVVEIAYGGICGSDLHYWTHGAAGESILRAPMVLGHEVVGTVVSPASDGSGPGTGTRVAVHPASPAGDGVTRYPADRPNLSPGCTYLGSAARFPHTDGAFVRYATLPSRMLRALPEGLSLRTAAAVEPAAVAWHGVARAGAVTGRSVLVIGAGPIGALVVAVLRRAGAEEIVAVDLHDHPLAVARALGATRTLLATDAEAIAAVQADVAIDSSGSPRGLASAIRGTARGGRVVMVGLLPTGDQPVPMSLAITRELELVGSFRFNDEIDEVITALADGSLVVDPVLTHEYPVAGALEAFAVARDASRSSKVLLRFDD